LIKRRYALVFALVFCLAATLFIVTGIGYDPWVDQDEDGDVDASDLNVLAGEYGSTGDPTKNVSVTNWPTPQASLFPETLILKTTKFQAGTTRYDLIDETAPYLPGSNPYDPWSYVEINTTSVEVYNRTFIYENVPTRSYKILGRPTIAAPFNVTQTEPIGYFVVLFHAYVGKVSFVGDWTPLGYLGSIGRGYTGIQSDYLIRFFSGGAAPVNTTINAYERLAIRFVINSYTTGDTGNLQMELLSNENEHCNIYIPIVEDS